MRKGALRALCCTVFFSSISLVSIIKEKKRALNSIEVNENFNSKTEMVIVDDRACGKNNRKQESVAI